MHDWPQMTKEVTAQIRQLRADAPEVMRAFAALAQAASTAQALDAKTALDRGASKQEITEALGMAIYMGAGPSVMYATHALDALGQFAAAEKA